jgi:hypothetical protein
MPHANHLYVPLVENKNDREIKLTRRGLLKEKDR